MDEDPYALRRVNARRSRRAARDPRELFEFTLLSMSREMGERAPPKGKHRFPLGKPLPETTIAYELHLTRVVPLTAPGCCDRQYHGYYRTS